MEPNILNAIINFIKPEDFMPHGQCLLWKPDLLGLHVGSDLFIVLAYYSIPVALVHLVRKREDLSFGWIFILFGLFIFLCGTTHLVNVITIWEPMYWLEGWVKAITGVVSVLTAILLWSLIPKAISLPSSDQLKAVNEELKKEIEERKRVEETLKTTQGSLEKAVQERTSELQEINRYLTKEISVRKSTETQLKESQQRLNTIFDSALDAIVVVDKEGHFMKWNKQAENIFGWSQSEIKGKTLVETIIPERYHKAHLEGVQRFLSTGEAKVLNTRIEIEALNRKTKEFPVELSIAYSDIQDPSFIAFISDITHRKNVEKELIQAKEEAESSNHAKSEFLARMSHELRTPMNAILGFGQLLKMDPENPLQKGQKDSVQRILKAGKHLLNLINEVLDLAKVESGKMELSLESIKVRSLLDEVYGMVAHLAEEIKIKVEIQSNEEAYVFADYIRLKQILLNLISNAIKYNKVNGSVFIDYKKEARRVRINVTDTGKGILKEKQEQIFQPFTRVDADLDEIEGTGIGLTITKRLVENMNGTISFKSEFNKGSVFSVEFPEADKQGVQLEKEGSETKEIFPMTNDKKVKILYVEDNPDNLDLVKQIMSRRPDIDLMSTSDAETGIEIARGERPSLIIMDIHLPGMDGLTAFQRLKNYEETVSIPVIALSADAMEVDKNKALALGFESYLTKPIDIPEFLETIDRFLV